VQITLLTNSRSGRGRAETVAQRLRGALEAEDRHIRIVRVASDPRSNGSIRLEDPADAVVVVGGDGTVNAALDALCASETPVYHAPLGTENLFAREFAMTERPRAVEAALRDGAARWIDVAHCDGRRFAIMASVGFDASVIHRVHKTRNGGVRRLSYLRPIVAEFFAMRPPVMRIEVDRRVIVDGEPGLLVVANSRQYAVRLDPARSADPTDGLLDVVFFPVRGRFDLLRWLIKCALGRHVNNPRLVQSRGAAIEVAVTEGRFAVQIDGEPCGEVRDVTADEPANLSIGVEPGAVRVLTPARRLLGRTKRPVVSR